MTSPSGYAPACSRLVGLQSGMNNLNIEHVDKELQHWLGTLGNMHLKVALLAGRQGPTLKKCRVGQDGRL